MESPPELIVKCCFLDDILQRDGSTGDVIEWQFYHWKMWDVQWLITENAPCEAISLEQAGIDLNYLESIAGEASCVPLLREVEALHGASKGYRLSKEYEAKLTDIEKPLIVAIRLVRLK